MHCSYKEFARVGKKSISTFLFTRQAPDWRYSHHVFECHSVPNMYIKLAHSVFICWDDSTAKNAVNTRPWKSHVQGSTTLHMWYFILKYIYIYINIKIYIHINIYIKCVYMYIYTSCGCLFCAMVAHAPHLFASIGLCNCYWIKWKRAE